MYRLPIIELVSDLITNLKELGVEGASDRNYYRFVTLWCLVLAAGPCIDSHS